MRLQHRVCILYYSLFCSTRCYKYIICPIKFSLLFGFNPKLVPYYRNVKMVYIPWRVSNTFILQTPPHFSVESPGQLVLHSDRGTMTSAGGVTWPHQHSCPTWTPAKENPLLRQAAIHFDRVMEGKCQEFTSGRTLSEESFTHCPVQESGNVIYMWCKLKLRISTWLAWMNITFPFLLLLSCTIFSSIRRRRIITFPGSWMSPSSTGFAAGAPLGPLPPVTRMT